MLFIEKNVPNKRQAKLLKARCLSKINSKPALRNPLLLYLWIKLLTSHKETREKQGDIQHVTLFDSIPSSRAEIFQAFVSHLFNDYMETGDFFKSLNQLPLKTSFVRTNSEKRLRGRIDFDELSTGIIDFENVLMDLSFKLQCRNEISCKYSYALEVAEAYTECSKSGRIRAKKLLHACIWMELLTRNNSNIEFGINRSFQEFFAALKLKRYIENGMDISKAFRHPGWENVIVFTSELLESGEEFVNSIISSGNLDLASKCAVRVSADTKEKLCALLARKLDSTYIVEKVRAVQSLGRLDAYGIKAISEALKDKDIVVKREIAKVLGETRS